MKHMRNVTVTRVLAIEMTSNDWGLYDRPGVARVADNINRGLMSILNRRGITRDQAETECTKVLAKYKEYGADSVASDTLLRFLLALKFEGDE